MKIEDLGVSEKCLVELKRVGFIEVEDLVEFLEQWQMGAMFRAGWPKYFDEIIQQLKLLGLWSANVEQKWPSHSQ